MPTERVVIVGAGIGGLAAAMHLATRGLAVTVTERAGAPGGKMRQVEVAGHRIDAGPTVLTLRNVFERLFADAGTSLDAHVTLRPLDILARHAWDADTRLDLYADRERSAEAIGALAGPAEARRFRAFCAHARRVWETLERPFVMAAEPSLPGLLGGVGAKGLARLPEIRPFSSLWRELGSYFHDPRLRQLFGRYATYCGSSPFDAPATLMLVVHVELEGVWTVEGGMHRLASAMAAQAQRAGAHLRYAAHVAEILFAGGRAAGVRLADGEELPADAVIVNADVAALATGRLGAAARRAVPSMAGVARSLSALTWCLHAPAEGFPLVRHNVFFSRDYRAEFDDILLHGRLPAEPTVYVCAQDRDDEPNPAGAAGERLLCLVNAPAVGDSRRFDATEIAACEARTFACLERCGLRLARSAERQVVTTPQDFAELFPATGGALYGRATHGWRASFARPGVRTRLPGLYLAGGSVHPGPGVPMVALSGRAAAAAALTDLTSTRP